MHLTHFLRSLLVVFSCCLISSQAATIDFEDISLSGDNTVVAEAFSSGGAEFPGSLQFDCCWTGWILSNSSLNQDLAVSPGALPEDDPLVLEHRSTAYLPPAGPGNNYAVAVLLDSAVNPNTGRTADQTTMTLPAGESVVSLQVANTTWAAHSMIKGDAFTVAFEDDDSFRLSITGYDGENTTGTVDVTLAAGRDIADDWQTISLAELGAATSLQFSLSSTSTSEFGGTNFINTPAYFAIDNVVTAPVPEPNGVALVMIGAVLIQICRRRK